MLEPGDRADSNSAVREDVWVRIPPAAPDLWSDHACLAVPPDVSACADVRDLGETYVYLLGLYLGDGTISRARRNVWRLRIFQDNRYPGLIAACDRAMAEVSGKTIGRIARTGCVELFSNWKHWVCLFPQHGPGRKHQRRIVLQQWQEALTSKHPEAFVRGLIHSDGCRCINRVRRPTRAGVKTYEYPRYFFTTASQDIQYLFVDACRRLGIACRRTNARNLSVARRRSVEILDAFVGPKS